MLPLALGYIVRDQRRRSACCDVARLDPRRVTALRSRSAASTWSWCSCCCSWCSTAGDPQLRRLAARARASGRCDVAAAGCARRRAGRGLMAIGVKVLRASGRSEVELRARDAQGDGAHLQAPRVQQKVTMQYPEEKSTDDKRGPGRLAALARHAPHADRRAGAGQVRRLRALPADLPGQLHQAGAGRGRGRATAIR